MLSPTFHHTLPCFNCRDGRASENETAYVEQLTAGYEGTFQQLGPSTICAVIIEPIGGATLCCQPACKGYLARLRQLCTDHGALFIYDEVTCGMGRAGTLHAWQSLGGISPDLQTIGEVLAVCYQPLSTVISSERVHPVMKRSAALKPFISGHTYQEHAIAYAAGLATQRYLIKNNLLQNVQERVSHWSGCSPKSCHRKW